MPVRSLDYRTPPRDPALLYTALYAGEIVRYSGLPEMAAIITATRTFVEERLAHPPVEIHRYVEHEELAPRLAAIQRDYGRSSEVKRLWKALFEAAGLDPEDTARDRLVLRFQVHSDVGTTLPWARSTATVGFHRDTWGTNLPAQVNWWAPVWPITEGRTFAIHPALWDEPIENNSAEFDLADVMQRLRTAPGTLGPGQLAPRPLRPVDAEDGVPVVIEPAEIIAFSSAHAHVACRTTRASRAFRLRRVPSRLPMFAVGGARLMLTVVAAGRRRGCFTGSATAELCMNCWVASPLYRTLAALTKSARKQLPSNNGSLAQSSVPQRPEHLAIFCS